jgi:hypothetical protein
VLLWLFMAVVLVSAPPLLIGGWLTIQHLRKQRPLKARQIIVLIIALLPAAFFAGISVWSVAMMLRSMMFK